MPSKDFTAEQRSFLNYILLFFLTHLSLSTLRLCVSAPLRFIQSQNALKRTFSLPFLCGLCGLFFAPAFLSIKRYLRHTLRFFLTQSRKDATIKYFTTEHTEITEKNKRSERRIFNPIHQFFLSKNHSSLRLCVSAPLRFIQLQNALKRTFSLPFLCGLCVLCGLFFVPSSLLADPWGKDADLARCRPSPPSCEESQSGPGVAFSELFIQFHQEVISPADGPRSHFYPSSSQYTLDAVRRYGFFKGWMMGCDRLMRENDDPWVYKKCLNPAGQLIKYDPVK